MIFFYSRLVIQRKYRIISCVNIFGNDSVYLVEKKSNNKTFTLVYKPNRKINRAYFPWGLSFALKYESILTFTVLVNQLRHIYLVDKMLTHNFLTFAHLHSCNLLCQLLPHFSHFIFWFFQFLKFPYYINNCYLWNRTLRIWEAKVGRPWGREREAWTTYQYVVMASL